LYTTGVNFCQHLTAREIHIANLQNNMSLDWVSLVQITWFGFFCWHICLYFGQRNLGHLQNNMSLDVFEKKIYTRAWLCLRTALSTNYSTIFLVFCGMIINCLLGFSVWSVF
jgi:hypothetical protein